MAEAQIKATNYSTELENSKHPKGLYLCGFTIMWERFSYYGMKSVLMLYLASEIAKGGFGLGKGTAGLVMGWFAGLVYLTPVLGGFVADRFIGSRKSMSLGLMLIAIGQFSLFAANSKAIIYLGLALIIFGNGFFKPNLNTVAGALYEKEDPRKDAAFSILYMFINFGAFVAPLVCGTLAEQVFAIKSGSQIISYGFRYAFLASAISVLIGLISFILAGNKLLGDVGKYASHQASQKNNNVKSNAPLTKQEKNRTIVIIILAMFVIFFWMLFEQGASSLTIFTNDSVNRNFMGSEIPTAWFQSVNAILCVILAPIMGTLWVKLAKSKKGDLDIPTKMGLGLILLGIGCFFVVFGVMQKNFAGKANMIWVLSFYLFETIGEMCLSPVGTSMVSKLAPVKIASMIMGIWFISNFIAGILSGYVAELTANLGELQVFAALGVVVILLGLLLISIRKKLTAMME